MTTKEPAVFARGGALLLVGIALWAWSAARRRGRRSPWTPPPSPGTSELGRERRVERDLVDAGQRLARRGSSALAALAAACWKASSSMPGTRGRAS